MTQNVAAVTSLLPQILCSTRIASTAETTVYTVPGSTGAVIKHGTLCNTTGAAVTVSLSLVPSGGTAGATNRVISSFSLPANDTQPLRDYLAGACLGPQDFVSIQVGTADAVVLALTGMVNS